MSFVSAIVSATWPPHALVDSGHQTLPLMLSEAQALEHHVRFALAVTEWRDFKPWYRDRLIEVAEQALSYLYGHPRFEIHGGVNDAALAELGISRPRVWVSGHVTSKDNLSVKVDPYEGDWNWFNRAQHPYERPCNEIIFIRDVGWLLREGGRAADVPDKDPRRVAGRLVGDILQAAIANAAGAVARQADVVSCRVLKPVSEGRDSFSGYVR